jgi:hypothetical protein
MLLDAPSDAPTPRQVRDAIQERMTAHGAFIRSVDTIDDAVAGAKAPHASVTKKGMRLVSRDELLPAIQNIHLALTHVAFLQTIQTLIQRGGGSRGGYMVLDEAGDLAVQTKRGTMLPHRSENKQMRDEVLETRLVAPGDFEVNPVPVRPLPEDDSWYETTWREWLTGRIYQTGD